jgi:hypothetical protein
MNLDMNGERKVIIGRDAINTIIVTGDHNLIFSGDYERLRDAYIRPWPVLERVGLDSFVGREWLVREIDLFLQEHESGYFIIEARAGLGKTAFLAWLMQQRGYIHHFAELAPGTSGVARTLKSLAAQIVRAYELNAFEAEGVLPIAAGRADFFYDLLKQAAERREVGEKIVLVIDGLNEAGILENQNVLGLPKLLPPGVFIIASQRPVPVGLEIDTARTPRRILTLTAEMPGNLDDVRRYLERIALSPEIADKLRTSGQTPAELVHLLLEKSQGLWIYLHFVIPELRHAHSSFLKLADLPDGIVLYYARYWKQLRDQNVQDWDQVYLPLLATLAAAQEAVSIDCLLNWTGGNLERQQVQRLLSEQWNPFLSAYGTPRLFQLYHATLREFFCGKVRTEELSSTETSFIYELAAASERAHGRIADHYLQRWGGLKRGLPWLRERREFTEDNQYGLRYLCAHLEQGRHFPSLHRLLQTEYSASRRVAISPPGFWRTIAGKLGIKSERTLLQSHLAWYEARQAAGDAEDFAEDIARAWQVADKAGESAHESKRREALALQCRYALLKSSLTSRANKIPAELLAALIDKGLWSSAQGLAYALRQSNHHQRNASLLKLAPRLARAGFHQEAIAAVKRIDRGIDQSQALKEVALHLPAEMHDFLLERSRLLMTCRFHIMSGLREETDEDIVPSYRATVRGEVMEGVLPALPPALLGSALEVAMKVKPELDRVYVLSVLLERLPDGERQRVLEKARQLAESLPDDAEQTLALTRLGKHLPPSLQNSLVSRLLGLIRRPESNGVRGWAMEGLVSLLPDVAFTEAELEEIFTILDKQDRFNILIKLASHLPLLWLRRAVSLSLESNNVPLRTSAFVKLAPHLDAPLRVEVLAAARYLPEKDYSAGLQIPRLEALASLADFLPEPERASVWSEIESLMQSYASDTLTANALAKNSCFAKLAQAGRATEALRLARSIEHPPIRISALVELLPFMPLADQRQTLQELAEETQTIKDEESQLTATSHLLILADHPEEAGKLLLENKSKIEDESIAELAQLFAEHGYLDEALRAIGLLPAWKSVWRNTSQAKALAAIAPYLQASNVQKPLKMIRQIKEPSEQSFALAALFQLLPESRRSALLITSLRSAKAVNPPDEWASVLSSLWPHYTERDRDEVLGLLQRVKSESQKAESLAQIAKDLSPACLQAILTGEEWLTEPKSRVQFIRAVREYLPIDERATLLRKELVRAWESEKDSLNPEVSIEIASYLLTTVYGDEILSVIHSSFLIGAQANFFRRLASRLSDSFLREVLSSADSWSNQAMWARGMEKICEWLLKEGHVKDAISLLQAIPYRESKPRIGAWTRILPQLENDKRLEVLDKVLEYATNWQSDISRSSLFSRRLEKNTGISMLIPYLQSLPYTALYPLWRRSLHELSSSPREGLLSNLQILAPVIVAQGGNEALLAVIQEIRKVGSWFR